MHSVTVIKKEDSKRDNILGDPNDDATWRQICFISPKILGGLIKVINTTWHYSLGRGSTDIAYSRDPLIRYTKLSLINFEEIATHKTEFEAIKYHLWSIQNFDEALGEIKIFKYGS